MSVLTFKVDVVREDAIRVLPLAVKKVILIPLIEEPDKVDITKMVLALRVLPAMVENSIDPPNKVEVIAVEVISVLP